MIREEYGTVAMNSILVKSINGPRQHRKGEEYGQQCKFMNMHNG